MMKKNNNKVKGKISNRLLYTLIAIGILTIIGMGVYAVAPNPGHSANELDLSGGVNGNAVFNGNLIVDTNTLFVDATNNRIGIGMNSPSQQLQITRNMLIPTAVGNTNGNLFFGGDPSSGGTGLRLFFLEGRPGFSIFDANSYIDTNTFNSTDGIIFRVNTLGGSANRMRIRADGIVQLGDTINSGELYVRRSEQGLILVAPNGHCARVTLSNTNSLVATTITCPAATTP